MWGQKVRSCVWFHLEAYRVKEAIKFYSTAASGFFVSAAN